MPTPNHPFASKSNLIEIVISNYAQFARILHLLGAIYYEAIPRRMGHIDPKMRLTVLCGLQNRRELYRNLQNAIPFMPQLFGTSADKKSLTARGNQGSFSF